MSSKLKQFAVYAAAIVFFWHPQVRRTMPVLQMLLQGKPNKVIARDLAIAEGIVKTHLWAIYQALGVNSRLQAMAKAHELGLVEQFDRLQ